MLLLFLILFKLGILFRNIGSKLTIKLNVALIEEF
jgi:hypothetical protein